MKIIVVDGMGGGLGAQLLTQIAPLCTDKNGCELIALGTNALATGNMLRAGAHRGATGENAICFSAHSADLILGPIGVVIPHAMMGEISPAIAAAVAAAPAVKLLLPVNQSHVELVGVETKPMGPLIKEAVARVETLLSGRA